MVKVEYVTGDCDSFFGDSFRHDVKHHVFIIFERGCIRPIMITDHSVAVIGLWDEENGKYK